MAGRRNRRRLSRDQYLAPRRKAPEFQEVPVEKEADTLGGTFLRGVGRDAGSLGAALAGAGGAMQAWTLDRLQRQHGNAFVQRVVAASLSRQTSEQDEAAEVEPVVPVEGQGQAHEAVVHANPPSVRLRGTTRARFNGGSFRTENVTTLPASSCRGCGRRNCVNVTGDLVTEYVVTTTVTLPRVSQFPRLTPCQRERVQDGIDTVLAPHEQEHVAAFEQYNGETQRSFNMVTCRAAFPGAIRRMVREEERPRRAAAQAASDGLDPFHFDVDLDCTDD
jgi:hypothetical protein